MKFIKLYELRVQLQDGSYKIIRPPMTIEFAVDRHSWASANQSNIKIYNLSQSTRKSIFRDWFEYGPTYPVREVQLFGGYEHESASLSLIFRGRIFYAHSTRRGPDVMTEIECMDPGIEQYSAVSSYNLQANVSKADVIASLYGDLKNTGSRPGIIGPSFSQEVFGKATDARGKISMDSTIKQLTAITGTTTYGAKTSLVTNNFFYDLNTPIALGGNEALDNPAMRVLSPDNGLLNVPVKTEAQIIAQMMFTPQILVGQQLIVQAYEDDQYNGKMKVIGVKHNGIISGTHDSQTTTTVTMIKLASNSTLVPGGVIP